MEDSLLVTVLLLVVTALLTLDILVAIYILKLLKTLQRSANLLEAILDDVDNFRQVVRKIKVPITFVRLLHKLTQALPADTKRNKSREWVALHHRRRPLTRLTSFTYMFTATTACWTDWRKCRRY